MLFLPSVEANWASNWLFSSVLACSVRFSLRGDWQRTKCSPGRHRARASSIKREKLYVQVFKSNVRFEIESCQHRINNPSDLRAFLVATRTGLSSECLFWTWSLERPKIIKLKCWTETPREFLMVLIASSWPGTWILVFSPLDNSTCKTFLWSFLISFKKLLSKAVFTFSHQLSAPTSLLPIFEPKLILMIRTVYREIQTL